MLLAFLLPEGLQATFMQAVKQAFQETERLRGARTTWCMMRWWRGYIPLGTPNRGANNITVTKWNIALPAESSHTTSAV